jgi:hypothetical protein
MARESGFDFLEESYLIGVGDFFLLLKWPRHEANLSSSAGSRNMWSDLLSSYHETLAEPVEVLAAVQWL